MKVLLLKDETWALLRERLKDEHDCAQSNVAWARAWEIKYSLRHHNMARLRKRRLEAARLVREVLHQ